MDNTMQVSVISTSFNERVQIVKLSPWQLPTYVVDSQEATSEGPLTSQAQPAFEIPDNVEIQEWLKLTAETLSFWDNDEDSIYDTY